MLPVNDLRKGDAIILDGETYLVMDAHFHRAQQRKANVRTKLKNMIKGNIIEKTFSSTESVEEADISYRKAQYLYEEGNSYIFMILDNYEQVHVDAEVLGDNKYYLLDNSEVDLQYIPIKSYYNCLGKTIFLTCEEAEKKLEEVKKNDRE